MALLATPSLGFAMGLPGDLDGDGHVDADDEALLRGPYGGIQGDASYDPAADLDGSGKVDVSDLALFGTSFGQSGGEVDATPPGLFTTLNDIPDDMNDLLVVPPDGFQITLQFDSLGGSLVDAASFVATSTEDVGAIPAGADLSGQFTITPTGATWEIPAGADLARTAHFVTASVLDVAGNEAMETYGFAVRDFVSGAPLGNLQRIHVDFDQDRTLGPEVDFIESLREFGLSSVGEPGIEAIVRDQVIAGIIARLCLMYGWNADGTPAADPVNVEFFTEPPVEPHSRICVGGESTSGGSFLGSAALDENNVAEFTDECGFGPTFGVFPHAIDNLWGGSATYQQAFSPFIPGLGGTPIGEHPEDAAIFSGTFSLATATPGQFLRFFEALIAFHAFSQTVAVATAHEIGHMLGLVAHGDAPGGLYGGDSGNQRDHNVTPTGSTPVEPFIMNTGASFSFDEITGLSGLPTPTFRPLAAAYLRDRVALNDEVTGLFPGPALQSVSPNPLSFGGSQNALLTFHGENFVGIPLIELLGTGPVPSPVTGVSLVDSETATGTVWTFFLPPGLYDVRFVNGDGQELLLQDGLLVQ